MTAILLCTAVQTPKNDDPVKLIAQHQITTWTANIHKMAICPHTWFGAGLLYR